MYVDLREMAELILRNKDFNEGDEPTRVLMLERLLDRARKAGVQQAAETVWEFNIREHRKNKCACGG